jgi:chemotaxis protein MotA
MILAGALVFLLICVFGSYLASGGGLVALTQALPFELWTIGGAAIAAFVMGNTLFDVKHTLGSLRKILKGAAHRKPDYIALLSLLYVLVRLARIKGYIAVEPHVERPNQSPEFKKYPRLLADPHASAIICDYMRMIGMDADDPNQIDDLMARELRKTLNEEMCSATALHIVADGLPALGIVAAVLGVIKTMSHIDRPPAELGAMIASALTGTFLGVLLSYGVAGPIAAHLQSVIQEEAKFYEVIRAVLVMHLHGVAPRVSVEAGRKMVPNKYMPSFQELEEALDVIQFAPPVISPADAMASSPNLGASRNIAASE